MKDFRHLAIATILMLFSLPLQAQPVFSEYVEGSGSNRCIEIWNSGTTSLDLDDYGYRFYQNGSATPTTEFVLPAVTLLANEVYVICHPSADVACTGNADATDSRIQPNGDDAIALYDANTLNNVDIFGSIGEDPGSHWSGACGFQTADRTLRRLSSATAGVTGASSGFPTLCDNWVQYQLNNCESLGIAPTDEVNPTCFPIISEYVEGLSSCKFIEVYNPCCDAIDLSYLEIRIHFNACTSTYTIPLSGIVAGDMLASGSTVVLYNPYETCSSYYVSNMYPSNYKGTYSLQHNGNDAVVLVYTVDGSYKDIVGNICENIVWTDANCSLRTENTTLRRKSTVCSGVTTDPATGFPTLCSEWDSVNVNNVSGIGSHTSTCLSGCETEKQAQSASAAAMGLHITAYPNPFAGNTTIRFQVAENVAAQLEVYNLVGERIAVLFQGNAFANQVYELDFDGNNLPSGTYIYRLLAGTEQRFGKLSLMH